MAAVATAPLVTVVIPTFNNRFLIELCLRSMRRCTGSPFCVIVKDNGSTDGTLEYVEASGLADLVLTSTDNDFDNVEYRVYDEVIRNHVRTPFFLVCHSDIVFLQADWIEDIRRNAGNDEANVMGGRIFPARGRGDWILGPWLSPWYAWGRTAAFKELRLTWQRKSPAWCARHLAEVREYFGEDLLAENPGARLFWEHGGYLISQIDRQGRTIVDCEPAGVFHLGDMTGSVVKGAHFPDAPDVPGRVSRAASIRQFIQRTLAEGASTDDDLSRACQAVVAFARDHDFAILQQYRG
jgi:hypothetical protein